MEFLRKNRKHMLQTVAVISVLLIAGLTTTYLIGNNIYSPIMVEGWITDSTTSDVRLQKLPLNSLTFGFSLAYNTFQINSDQQYQTMQGFGAAMTDSAAWLLHENLNASAYNATMHALFDPTIGIGINYLRIPLGASDCARRWYTYDDSAPDLSDFSIAVEEQYLLPTLRDALKINSQLRFMGSPWSAPGWMKLGNNLTDPTTKGLIGGYLNPECYAIYAEYLILTVQAFFQAGIPLDAISLQNEQFFTPADYPGMAMNVTATQAFLSIFGPKWDAANLTTKVFILDHNWIYSDQVLSILANNSTRQYIDGIAWHGYEAAEPNRQQIITNQYPELHQYFTEISPLRAYTSFPGNLAWTLNNIIHGSISNGAETILFWNLALDPNGAPHLLGNSGLRGVVEITPENGSQMAKVDLQGEYYMLAHLTKFIPRGSIRLGLSDPDSDLKVLGFQSPSREIVVIAGNPTDDSSKLRLNWQHRILEVDLPGKSLATFRWAIPT